MESLCCRAAAAALCALAAFLFPIRSHACSVCQAGDPIFNAQGASAQERGAFSLYLDFQSSHKTSGLAPHGEAASDHDEDHEHEGEEGEPHEHGASGGSEKHDLQQLDLYASWTPIDRFTFTVDVPFRFHTLEEREPDAMRTTGYNSGFGDVALWLSTVLWRDRDVLPSTWLEGRLMLKTPTGRSDERIDGTRDPHIQLGTGSWDWGAGFAVGRRLARGSLYASTFYRVNTEGSWDYEYGDVFLANVAFEAPLSHAFGLAGWDWLTPGFELNFRFAGSDHSGGQRYEDSGGSIAFATPSLRIRLPWVEEEGSASMRLGAQIPLGQGGLNGQQHERTTWTAGLLYAF